MTRAWETAASRGDVDQLRRLLASGAGIDSRDGHGQTALLIAARHGHDRAVAWLIDAGAGLDHTAKYGLSALMLAVLNGHAPVVRLLAAAGADTSLRGRGAPGFADKTALDLAIAKEDRELVDILRSTGEPAHAMTAPAHFEIAASWKAARAKVAFRPREPDYTGARRLQSIRIHVRDHRLRELPVEDRTLEAHYGAFDISQARRRADEARRLALDVSYGPEAREARVGGHAARVYELGPEPEPGDPDGRSPSVVTWHEDEMFYLIASSELPSDELLRIAASLYR